jgi:hypothetical protein
MPQLGTSSHFNSKGGNNIRKLTAMRWWMVGLVTAASIVNYLAGNTLSVAAPTAH